MHEIPEWYFKKKVQTSSLQKYLDVSLHSWLWSMHIHQKFRHLNTKRILSWDGKTHETNELSALLVLSFYHIAHI